MNLAQALTDLSVVAVFGSTELAGIIAREFKYCKDKATLNADPGSSSVYRSFTSDFMPKIDERIALEYAAHTALLENGRSLENGQVKFFTPVIFPFLVDENGEVKAQLRVYVYRPRMEEGSRLPKQQLVFRLEPANTVTAFDASSEHAKYVNPEVAAEIAAEPF